MTEKNQTARRIAEILSGGKAKHEGGTRSTTYAYMEGGDEVKVIGMRGHVLKVDFPEEYRGWQEVEPRALIDAEIVKIPTEKTFVNNLKKLAKEASDVVIATDYDREGELIGADIRDIVAGVNPEASFSRARFSALTASEIKEAFASPDTLDENLAKAGEARQDIDLIWGAALTRFISLATNRLWQRFLSVGRVQSPTLALVVDREAEIAAFVPEDYWQIRLTCRHGEDTFTARHTAERFTDETAAREAFDRVGATGEVTEVKTRDRTINPPAPFNTTSFLAAASSLRITPARAMEIAESLYSRGYISYPRVDNTVYPPSLDLAGVLKSMQGAQEVGPLAGELLGKGQLTATRGKKQSTDHPPIYPTGAPDKGKLSSWEWRIYELVARRFMATVSDAAHARSTRVDLDVGGEPFFARGDVIVTEGFLRYYPYSRKRDEELPPLSAGDSVEVVDKEIEAKQTQPPPRYSEGNLIQKMEELGLGTKSTRHNIIQSLLERGYVFGTPLRPSQTGIAVSRALEAHATTVTSPDMTATLEQDMDAIVEGQKSLQGVVDHSREVLDGVLAVMESQKEEISREIKEGMRGDTVLGACPGCDGELGTKTAKKSGKRFAGCMNYPECTTTFPLPQKGSILATGEVCEECATPRIKVLTKGRKPWELCLDPDCPTKPKRQEKAPAGKADTATAEASAGEPAGGGDSKGADAAKGDDGEGLENGK
ncbi:MAG: DNA topoisomerase I [Actinobacteria bacterium]|nr:DNA topoisomerase I [Actinomycetota bacterium]MBU1942332.1 DNA topoisomerase I [Actinomycetota bacterium]MBU2686888.1 DNA topoisomerase I [Actinomycetota bacterium]